MSLNINETATRLRSLCAPLHPKARKLGDIVFNKACQFTFAMKQEFREPLDTLSPFTLEILPEFRLQEQEIDEGTIRELQQKLYESSERFSTEYEEPIHKACALWTIALEPRLDDLKEILITIRRNPELLKKINLTKKQLESLALIFSVLSHACPFKPNKLYDPKEDFYYLSKQCKNLVAKRKLK